ncbi:hypothetical protein Q9290_02745 [Oceanimonas sp. CHS3-5]|uniref:hypothetical protein n=1 Tax=Oceanimonas sp. CHS3-5 TaxID=3068186 RepID=UPI00273D6A3A|nr:hypothetical protein [Oceanimonas sp. CHS3-5]MDP5291212.1 hypothetical protein [Oceanimonas sp. CHS3-5]
MSLIHCEQCGKPFFAHHRRCVHCRSLREDIRHTPVLRKPLSLLASVVAVAGLLLIWGLTESGPLHAADDIRGPGVEMSEPQP